MNRLFLRVYVGVAIAVLLVSAGSMVSFQRELREGAERHMAAALRPVVELTRDRLRRPERRPGPRPPHPDALGERLGLPMQVIPTSELPAVGPRRRATFDRGQPIMVDRAGERWIYAEVGPDEALAFGPIPQPHAANHWVWKRLVNLALMLCLIGGVLVLLLRPYERRLAALAAATERFGGGEMGARLGDTSEDAIGDVARAFDDMAARVQTTVQGQRELLHAVSHELRTPLARMLFLLDELADADSADASARYIDRLGSSVGEVDGLVDELLAFARLDAGLEALAKETVELPELLSAVARDIKETGATAEIVVRPDADRAQAHPRYLRRVIVNLVSNAARFAASTVWVTSTAVDGAVEIQVEDDGPGVPADEHERIFEPFAQADPSRSMHKGTGLGLAIARRIIERHGGSLRLEDRTPSGARFVVRLPDGD